MNLPSAQLPVLDSGFVQLVEMMGGDSGVVDAARVCYKSASSEPEKDRKLVDFLMTHEHMTPFEHSVFKFHVKAPLFVARQWFRHRSSSYNETSQRYAIVKDEFYFPTKWRKQSSTDKQGSVAGDLDHAALRQDLITGCRDQMVRYNRAIEQGAAKEMARFHLPVNVYTEWYWTVNARNLMAFIKLRSEAHAQWEIKQYSNTIWPLFAHAMPWAAEAFLHTLQMSKYGALDGVAGPNITDVLDARKEAANV